MHRLGRGMKRGNYGFQQFVSDGFEGHVRTRVGKDNRADAILLVEGNLGQESVNSAAMMMVDVLAAPIRAPSERVARHPVRLHELHPSIVEGASPFRTCELARAGAPVRN